MNRITDFLQEHINILENGVDDIESDFAIISHAAAINHIIYILLTGSSGDSTGHYEFISNFVHIKNASVTTLVL